MTRVSSAESLFNSGGLIGAGCNPWKINLIASTSETSKEQGNYFSAALGAAGSYPNPAPRHGKTHSPH